MGREIQARLKLSDREIRILRQRLKVAQQMVDWHQSKTAKMNDEILMLKKIIFDLKENKMLIDANDLLDRLCVLCINKELIIENADCDNCPIENVVNKCSDHSQCNTGKS